MALSVKSDETRRKIIDAAGKIFAEVGYETATVRQITESAGVNVSAINYHFGDKSTLYREVLTYGMTEMYEKLARNCSSGAPKDRLRGYVEVMMRDTSHEDRPWQHVIITREMFEQSRTSLVPDLLVELIRPSHVMLVSIVRDLLGPEASSEKVEIAAQIVIGILIHWTLGKDFSRRMAPELTFSDEQIDRIVEQVYQFVLGGFDGLNQK